jgi:hypothetical protein
MSRTIRRGLMAGAAGTAALNAATYLDMALRGRPSSTTPERAVEAAAARAGLDVPGAGAARQARTTALGALGGIATGLVVGVGASAARTSGLRLPAPLDVLTTSAAALVAGNASAVRLGVTDPRSWSATDWASDVVPHLAYGVVASAVLRETEPRELDRSRPVHVAQPPRPSRPRGLLTRCAAVGMASGVRSSYGVAAALLARPDAGPARGAAAALAVTGELAADKLPAMPSRLQPPSLAVRCAAGAGAGAAFAGQARAAAVLPTVVGGGAALAASYAGVAWRESAWARTSPVRAALAEDAAGLLLTAAALRARR